MRRADLAKPLSGELVTLAKGIAGYLASVFDVEKGFPAREFYGTAFASWLWSYYPERFSSLITAAFEQLRRVEKPSGERKYHWEFVRFALYNTLRNLDSHDDLTVAEILGDERFAHTRVANWTLLRSTTRLFAGGAVQAVLAWVERVAALLYYQQPWGFIEDERQKPSLQYHAFSTALLGVQLYDLGVRDTFTRSRFAKAIKVLDQLTLPGGQCNYWGRGQGQIFGYAAAILAFVLGYRLIGNNRYMQQAYQVLNFIKGYVRVNGSLPLVMRLDEPPEPYCVNSRDPNYLGWYSYNNYFDYVAFAGALLAKAAQLLDHEDEWAPTLTEREPIIKQLDRLVGDVRIFANDHYSAVVTRPFSSMASCLSMPYVAVRGEYPLPCYGGEESDSIYTPYGLPLPILIDRLGKRYSLYTLLRFRWVEKNTFEGKSSGVLYRRQFRFEKDKIIIRDVFRFSGHAGWRVETPRFLVYRSSNRHIQPNRVIVGGISIVSDRPLIPEPEPHYSPLGELVAYHGRPTLLEKQECFVESLIRINIRTGDER